MGLGGVIVTLDITLQSTLQGHHPLLIKWAIGCGTAGVVFAAFALFLQGGFIVKMDRLMDHYLNQSTTYTEISLLTVRVDSFSKVQSVLRNKVTLVRLSGLAISVAVILTMKMGIF